MFSAFDDGKFARFESVRDDFMQLCPIEVYRKVVLATNKKRTRTPPTPTPTTTVSVSALMHRRGGSKN